MFGRFLPRETSFFDFFEQHAALTVEGTKEFLSLVTTGANIPAKCRRISDIEHETDTITHRCVEALHKTFITPIDRDAIHRLITRMDDVMDYVEAAAERIELYEMQTMTAEGTVADVLLSLADKQRGDLIAVGSHERGLIDRLLIGSVRTQLLRKSACPVLIVPQHAEPRP